MGKMHKFLALGFADKRLLLRAGWLLSVTAIILQLIPYASVQRWLARPIPSPGASGSTSRHSMERIIWSVVTASRFVPGTTCLTQALVCARMLHREGHVAELHFGVAKERGNGILAHAWLESGGRIVLGGTSEAQHYTHLRSQESPGKQTCIKS